MQSKFGWHSRLKMAKGRSQHVHDVLSNEFRICGVGLGNLAGLIERSCDFVGGNELQELGQDLALVLEACSKESNNVSLDLARLYIFETTHQTYAQCP